MLNRSMQTLPFSEQGQVPVSVRRPAFCRLPHKAVSGPVTLVYGPALLLLLAACGGGSGGTQPAPVTVDLTASMAEGVYILKGADGQAQVVEITGDMDAVAIDKALVAAGVRADAEDGTTIFESDVILYYPDAVLNPVSERLPAGKTIAIYTGDSNWTGQRLASPICFWPLRVQTAMTPPPRANIFCLMPMPRTGCILTWPCPARRPV